MGTVRIAYESVDGTMNSAFNAVEASLQDLYQAYAQIEIVRMQILDKIKQMNTVIEKGDKNGTNNNMPK